MVWFKAWFGKIWVKLAICNEILTLNLVILTNMYVFEENLVLIFVEDFGLFETAVGQIWYF